MPSAASFGVPSSTARPCARFPCGRAIVYNVRVRTVFACVVALAAAGCFTPDLGEGQLLCGDNSSCPPRYHCAGDGKCYTTDPDLGQPVVGDLGCLVACAQQSCGVIGDNCGGTLDCGDNCSTGMSCGGGGTPHVCGCPTEVTCGGKNCGTTPDGCGGVLNCGGTCPTGQTCGGGPGANKKPNVCASGAACTPKVCKANTDCGFISDNCAAVLDCGACTAPKSCGADHLCH
jgi:hypothetical protein